MNYSYAYLTGCFILFLPWLYIFIKLRRVRREMILVGVLLGIFGLLTSRIFAAQYWHPVFILGSSIPLEDFLYGFLIGGIGSGALHFITRFGRHRKITYRRELQVFADIIITAIIFYVLVTFGILPMYAGLILLTGLTLFMYSKRRDLIVCSFFSAIILLTVTFLGFSILLLIYPNLIDRWWVKGELSNIYINSIPLEELLWAFCLGSIVGPLYEFISRDKVSLK